MAERIEMREDNSPSPELEINRDGKGRDNWSSNLTQLLAIITAVNGFGNFSTGAFLAYYGLVYSILFYVLVLFIFGFPILFLEYSLGQFAQVGLWNFWNCVPLAKGLAIMNAIFCFNHVFYLFSIMSPALIYAISALKGIGGPMPWATCDDKYKASESDMRCVPFENSTFFKDEIFETYRCKHNEEACNVSSAVIYSLKYFNEDNDQVSFCYIPLIASAALCVILYLMLFKGLRSIEKGFIVCFVIGVCCNIMFFIRVLTLPGATKYIYKHSTPSLDVRNVPIQVMFNLYPLQGQVLTISSYNKFGTSRSRINWTITFALLLLIVHVTISALTTLAINGYISEILDLSSIYMSVGLIAMFTRVPFALSHVDAGWFWTFIFFIQYLVTGLTHCVINSLVLITIAEDSFPRFRHMKEKVAAGFCFGLYLLGLPSMSSIGYRILLKVDIGSVLATIIIMSWSLFSLTWFYNVFYIGKDLRLMLGKSAWYQKILHENKIAWMLISLVVIFYIYLNYFLKSIDYIFYPNFYNEISFMMIVAPIVIPTIWAIGCIIYHAFFGRGFARAFQATNPWGPGDKNLLRQLLSNTNDTNTGRGITYKTATEWYEKQFSRKDRGFHYAPFYDQNQF